MTRGGGTAHLRRPSDLAREKGYRRARRGGRRRGSTDTAGVDSAGEAAPGWPAGFALAEEDREAVIVLLHLASLTPRRLQDLAADLGTAAACLDAVRAGAAGSDNDRALARKVDPARVRARLEATGARFVAVHDEGYPETLLDLHDPPAGLFVRGSLPREEQTCVSIVGARNCSPSGAEIAAVLARAVARAGGCVVSGGARGIDAAAHRGSLDAGPAEGEASSVAVLGCGIDVAYPAGNRRLLERVARHGAVISEYPPGTRAEPFRFPARNRIVAGLGRAVVVVEGAPGSGSLITADHALDLGREVFAVPGAVTSELAAAPLALIREGAGVIRGPDDLLDDLGLNAPSGGGGRGGGDSDHSRDEGMAQVPPGLSAVERAVWKALRAPCSADALARQAGVDSHGLMAALTELEIRGLVRQAGGRFERRGLVRQAGGRFERRGSEYAEVPVRRQDPRR